MIKDKNIEMLIEDYTRVLNDLAFEIHESYKIGILTETFKTNWTTYVSTKLIPVYPNLTRTKLSTIGPVTTILGDRFFYSIDDSKDVILYINGKIIQWY